MTAESAEKGMLVTTSTFTSYAITFAQQQGIQLINGTQLSQDIDDLRHNDSPAPEQKTTSETVTSTPTPPPLPLPKESITPVCPKCSQPMKLQTAKRGPNSGNQFWGSLSRSTSSKQDAPGAGDQANTTARQLHYLNNQQEGAQKHINELPQGKIRSKALESLAETWAKTDADSASQWAENLPDSEKSKAILSILPQMAKSSPAEAASHMESLLQSTPEKSQTHFSNAIYHMMDQWVEIDPSSAGSWVSGLD